MRVNQPIGYLYICGGAIGDSLLGMHLGRVLEARKPETRLTIVSTRRNDFVRELFECYGVDYREWLKGDWRSWAEALLLLRSPWKVGLFEPVTVGLPLWWRVLLWLASRRADGLEVRYQMKLHEHPTPRRARVFVYDCSQTNLFDLAPRIADAWGIPGEEPKPRLEPPSSARPYPGPYIVFHFFAGHVRRSVSVEHSKELIKAARKAYPGYRFILTCAGSEALRAAEVAYGVADVELRADLPARDMLALLAHASLVVGAASGIVHLAAHMEAQTIALCNLSDPCWLPSYNKEVTLLAESSRCGCGGNRNGTCEIDTPEGTFFRCLYDIPIGAIIAAMAKKLPQKPI
jgi:hypothetical protein